MEQVQETALITGGSSGIGLELARVFAQNEYDLVVVARRQEKLEALKEELERDYGINVTVLACDLSNAGSPSAIYDTLQRDEIHIDVLVNNAGLAMLEPFHAAPVDDVLSLVQVNVVALTHLTRLFVAPMIAKGRGRILNVASVVSFYPTPNFAAYGASKAFVLSLSEALSAELEKTGVTVTALCPGYTKTDMIDTALTSTGLETWGRFIPSMMKMDAASVAREGFKACMRGKAVHVTGLPNQFATEWIRRQPKWLVRRAGGIFARNSRNPS
jgi:short-subunit dehydrogenase